MERFTAAVEKHRDAILQTLSELIELPAISPASGGKGELRKSKRLIAKLEELGYNEIEVYNSPDPLAEGGVRPNVIVKIPGSSGKKMWFVSHIDVVPEGDITLWASDPFKAVIKDGHIIGRGVNDNGEEVVASIYAAQTLKDLKITPFYDICLCFVADEETGSKHGIDFLLKQGLFAKDDIVYVPDSGSLDGGFIEIAEKRRYIIHLEIYGKQVHSSIPNRGLNACRVANELSFLLDKALNSAFDYNNCLFDPPFSTFEPTMRTANVTNLNTVPGKEVFNFDCRILPNADMQEIENLVKNTVLDVEKKYNAKIVLKTEYDKANALPTSPDCPAVELLKSAVAKVLHTEIRVGGIGGGTCAAFFRENGIPAVVWGQANDSAHQANESVMIEHILNEAKVFACVMASGSDKLSRRD